ncbi:uncharacterized protein LOC111640046 isoform X2 [Centruroides sculpturatus]|uniref:uncharacterized protein LOC111640046 isoform X1 n=1 Tax=Centruroides sculpturatus TaxID=218467 RepID=UPI000C6CFC98|nr:uncharacterized protein LOC111640046 isoform X1 [Centruroides sculpturatus]XP_023241817.1 uncharacterized protein LOC111640046 isoform X2 [Centruroides sculpturatus]
MDKKSEQNIHRELDIKLCQLTIRKLLTKNTYNIKAVSSNKKYTGRKRIEKNKIINGINKEKTNNIFQKCRKLDISSLLSNNKKLHFSLKRIPAEIELTIKSKFDVNSTNGSHLWSDVCDYLKKHSTIVLNEKYMKRRIQAFLINRFPGITILLYMKNDPLFSNIISIPITILPKPFSSTEIEDMLSLFGSKQLNEIYVFCGLCNQNFCNAKTHLKELLIIECSEDPFGSMIFKNTFRCLICDCSSKCDMSIYEHIFLQHIIFKETYCSKCNLFTSLYQKIMDERKDAYNVKRREKETNESSKIICEYCKIFLLTEKELLEKLVRYTNDCNVYKCGICNRIRKEKSIIENHVLQHLKSDYIFCSECHYARYDYSLVKSIILDKRDNNFEMKSDVSCLKESTTMAESDDDLNQSKQVHEVLQNVIHSTSVHQIETDEEDNIEEATDQDEE